MLVFARRRSLAVFRYVGPLSLSLGKSLRPVQDLATLHAVLEDMTTYLQRCHETAIPGSGIRGGSLLCKIILCVRIRMPNFARPLHFLVMDNIFPVEMHEIYDLKVRVHTVCCLCVLDFTLPLYASTFPGFVREPFEQDLVVGCMQAVWL